MRTRTFILAGIATLGLGLGYAAAGPCTTEIDNVAKMLTAKDAGSGPTSGASGAMSPAGTTPAPQHPPTAIMGQRTEDKATSPGDVRRQTEGQPTAAQQGTTGMAGGSNMSEASAALDRARSLDQQGKEAECMDTVRRAQQLARPN